MLFNSFVFIFAFLPITFLLYFGLNRLQQYTAAKAVLVVASLYFYAYFNWSYLPIILSSIAINYLVAWRMKVDDKRWLRKLWMIIGVAFNIGMIGYFMRSRCGRSRRNGGSRGRYRARRARYSLLPEFPRGSGCPQRRNRRARLQSRDRWDTAIPDRTRCCPQTWRRIPSWCVPRWFLYFLTLIIIIPHVPSFSQCDS